MDNRASRGREAISTQRKVSPEHNRDAGKTGPLVSVMMPAYNCEKYVGEAIESIINQTYTNWELICVDDGSTDRTLEIMQEYAAKNPCIHVFANEENRGRPYTRNRILEVARGEILAIQDADDVSLPHRLEEGVKALEAEPDVAVAGSAWVEIDERGEMTGYVWTPPIEAQTVEGIPPGGRVSVYHGPLLMRAEAVAAVGGYDEFFALAQDYDLCLRMLSQGFVIRQIEEPWYMCREHDRRATRASRGLQQTYQVLARARAQAIAGNVDFDLEAEFEHLRSKGTDDPRLREQQACDLYGIGGMHIARSEGQAARKCFLAVLRLRPFFARAWIWYLLTFLPTGLRRALVDTYYRIRTRLRQQDG